MSKGVPTVLGINREGYREVLAVECANTENETTCATVFREPVESGESRAFNRSSLTITRECAAPSSATSKAASGDAARCIISGNLLKMVSKKLSKVLSDQLRDLFNAPERETAQQRVKLSVSTYSENLPQAAEFLENTADEVPGCFDFPEEHRKRIRSTNGLEGLDEEIRRRTRIGSDLSEPEILPQAYLSPGRRTARPLGLR